MPFTILRVQRGKRQEAGGKNTLNSLTDGGRVSQKITTLLASFSMNDVHEFTVDHDIL